MNHGRRPVRVRLDRHDRRRRGWESRVGPGQGVAQAGIDSEGFGPFPLVHRLEWSMRWQEETILCRIVLLMTGFNDVQVRDAHRAGIRGDEQQLARAHPR